MKIAALARRWHRFLFRLRTFHHFSGLLASNPASTLACAGRVSQHLTAYSVGLPN